MSKFKKGDVVIITVDPHRSRNAVVISNNGQYAYVRNFPVTSTSDPSFFMIRCRQKDLVSRDVEGED